MLRSFNASVRAGDGAIADELADVERAEVARPPHIDIESIVMRKQRPVLAIQDGTTTL